MESWCKSQHFPSWRQFEANWNHSKDFKLSDLTSEKYQFADLKYQKYQVKDCNYLCQRYLQWHYKKLCFISTEILLGKRPSTSILSVGRIMRSAEGRLKTGDTCWQSWSIHWQANYSPCLLPVHRDTLPIAPLSPPWQYVADKLTQRIDTSCYTKTTFQNEKSTKNSDAILIWHFQSGYSSLCNSQAAAL